MDPTPVEGHCVLEDDRQLQICNWVLLSNVPGGFVDPAPARARRPQVV